MRLFYTFNPRSRWVARFPWLEHARVTLNVENVFDERPSVLQSDGTVPLGLSAQEIDPVGRFVGFGLRKVIR